jgi:hypothetical protein
MIQSGLYFAIQRSALYRIVRYLLDIYNELDRIGVSDPGPCAMPQAIYCMHGDRLLPGRGTKQTDCRHQHYMAIPRLAPEGRYTMTDATKGFGYAAPQIGLV